jgi:hypothetical protein
MAGTKKERIEDFVGTLRGHGNDLGLSPFYTGFFECFNDQRYYEAHDVLEHLWLHGPGENYAYFKGLIQVAGAFVHLQKQFHRPTHPKDGRRLSPAARLFKLAMSNLGSYRPFHLHLDVEALYHLCEWYEREIVQSGFARNPWDPRHAPILGLQK